MGHFRRTSEDQNTDRNVCHGSLVPETPLGPVLEARIWLATSLDKYLDVIVHIIVPDF